jgi:hypothetical protein
MESLYHTIEAIRLIRSVGCACEPESGKSHQSAIFVAVFATHFFVVGPGSWTRSLRRVRVRSRSISNGVNDEFSSITTRSASDRANAQCYAVDVPRTPESCTTKGTILPVSRGRQSLAENLRGPVEHLKWNMSAGRIEDDKETLGPSRG